MASENVHNVPWDELHVTRETLPDCLRAIMAEPRSRHRFLIWRLADDYRWQSGASERGAQLDVLEVLLDMASEQPSPAPQEAEDDG